MAERGKLSGQFLLLTAVLSAVPATQGLNLRCLEKCNVKEDLTCLTKCASGRARRDADTYPQSGPCEPWPFTGHDLPYAPASPIELEIAENITENCYDGENRLCEGVTVQWKADLQAIRELRGFQVSLLRPGGYRVCHQIIIPESSVPLDGDDETVYNHTFFPLFPDGPNYVSVYSLPMDEHSPATSITIAPRSCIELNAGNPSDCGPDAWVPPNNLDITVAGRTVDTSFQTAPEGYGVIHTYWIFMRRMTCEESEFSCESWIQNDCDGEVVGMPLRIQPLGRKVLPVHFDTVAPGKYLLEIRVNTPGKTTCPTVFEVTDWAPPVDSIAITEDTWTCSAVVSFPADDNVPSYRVCMDDDCASISHDNGTSVDHTFSGMQPYQPHEIKVSDGRYSDAKNTSKTFTSMQGWAPNIRSWNISANADGGYDLTLTFKSPQCIQEYTVNVCSARGLHVCIPDKIYQTNPANEGFPSVTVKLTGINLTGTWTFNVKAANMPNAPEGHITIGLPPEPTTTKPATTQPPPTTMPEGSTFISTPTSPSNDSWKIGAAVGGVAAAVVLAAVLLYCWKHPRRFKLPTCRDDDDNPPGTGGMYRGRSDTTLVPLPDIQQKTVLLLASYDCAEHRTVVLCFAAYLQKECHCQVILDLHKTEQISKLGAMEWLVSHIHGVDYVIVVCSTGTKFKATKDKKVCQLQEIEPFGDLFTGGLKHINLLLHSRDEDMSKFINVYFPYSRKTDIPATLEIAKTFKLMQSMPALFCHIHRHPQYSMEGATHIGIAEQVESTESGRNLLKAIKAMEDMEASTPDWFMTRIVETPEQKDSAHGSLSSKTSGRGDDTSVQAPADINVTIDDTRIPPDDGFGEENEGYCPSIPMTLLNNGTIQYEPFPPQNDAYLYSGLPEPTVPNAAMMQHPDPNQLNQPEQFHDQHPQYGNHQDQYPQYGNHQDQYPQYGNHQDQYPQYGNHQDQHPQYGNHQDQYPQHDNHQDQYPQHDNHQDQYPQYGNQLDQHPQYGNHQDQYPQYGNHQDQYPQYGNHQDQHPQYGNHQDQHPQYGNHQDQYPQYGNHQDQHPQYGNHQDQYPQYGNQQDQDLWQPSYMDLMNNQHVPPTEHPPPRPHLKLHIPEPYAPPPDSVYPPQEQHVQQGLGTEAKEAITPESGCFSGESIEDQLSLFNLKSQAAFEDLEVQV